MPLPTKIQFLHPLILLSKSPRRREILQKADLEFEIEKGGAEPRPEIGELPKDFLIRVVQSKLSVKKWEEKKAITLAADTIVLLENSILGKPKNKSDAFQMLKNLSGKTHEVKTGWGLRNCQNGYIFYAIATTQVRFIPFTEKFIQQYVEEKNPLDKAGAYGIQEFDAKLYSIKGEYENVVGFPINQFLTEISQKTQSKYFLKNNKIHN